MKRDGDKFTLSSGREFKANCGFLSIAAPKPGAFIEIREGYDGRLSDRDPEGDPPQWTPEERRELAEYAITLWNAFAAGARVCPQCLGSNYIAGAAVIATTTVHAETCTAAPLSGEWSSECCGSCTGQLHRPDCPTRKTP